MYVEDMNSYDYRRRRISKTVQRLSISVTPPPSPPIETREWQTVATHTFVWDGNNIVLEKIQFANGATRTAEYFWGMDKSGTEQGAGGVGGLLAVSCSGQFYFPTFDNNGNVTKYIDESGNVVAAYEYDDFGRVISQIGPLADFFRHRFSTKYYDSETKLCYYGYRFYSPDWRIWLNHDPIGEAGGVNLSMFVFNNPMFQFDADGRVVMPITIAPPDFYVPAQGSQTPSLFDQLGSGTGPFHEENWFESNYSGWINTSKSLFIKEINKSIDCKNTQLNIKSSRQAVDPGIAGDIPWKMPVGGNDRLYGDNGQNNWQATLVLGKFAIDYVTPITIQYGTCNNGKRKYSWSTTMYVEDSLGLQGTESWLGKYFGWAAKSRRARRAHWIINGSGTCNCCE